MIVSFRANDRTFVGRVVRETTKLFYYVQLAGYSVELPPIKIAKSRCEILDYEDHRGAVYKRKW